MYDPLMPRYLIERTYTVGMDQLPTVATRSKAIRHHHYPEIVWEHSHVVVDGDGTPKSFCIYEAPNEEIVREHARQGGFPANRVSEVKTMIDPVTGGA